MSSDSYNSLDTATVADLCLEVSRRSSLSREKPTLPGYELHDVLGTGAFGQVYKASQKSTGQQVAVKVLFTVTEGFREEVKRLSHVSDHPNIVTLVDANLDFDPPYLVTPFLSGSLQEKIAGNVDDVDMTRVVRWFEEIVCALQFIHARGILHCDLKPANILLGEDDQARLVDFGQSVGIEGSELRLGSFWFMPWQQACLPGPDSSMPEVRWDIHALGATIYTLLTGQLPRASDSERQSLSQLQTGQEKVERYRKFLRLASLIPVRHLNPKVDRDLAAIVEKSLCQEDEGAYTSVGEVAEDLRRWKNQEPVKARHYNAFYWLERFFARHRLSVLMGVLAATLLFTGLTLASYEIYRERQARQALVLQQYDRGLSLLGKGRASGLVWLAKVCTQQTDKTYLSTLEKALAQQLRVADPNLYRLRTSTAPSPSGTKAIWSSVEHEERMLINLTNGALAPLPAEILQLNLNQKDTVRYRLDDVVLDPIDGSGGPATWRLPPSDSVSPAAEAASLAILVRPDLVLHAQRTKAGFRVLNSEKQLQFVAEGPSFSLSAPTFSLQGDLVVGWEDGRVEVFQRSTGWKSIVLDDDFHGELFRFSKSGLLLAGQDRNFRVKVWDLSGAIISDIQLGAAANELAFDDIGDLLVCVTRDALVHGHDVRTGKTVWSPAELEKPARWVFVQPSGRIVTMSDEVTVWEQPKSGLGVSGNLDELVEQVSLTTGWLYDDDARVRTLTREEYLRLADN